MPTNQADAVLIVLGVGYQWILKLIKLRYFLWRFELLIYINIPCSFLGGHMSIPVLIVTLISHIAHSMYIRDIANNRHIEPGDISWYLPLCSQDYITGGPAAISFHGLRSERLPANLLPNQQLISTRHRRLWLFKPCGYLVLEAPMVLTIMWWLGKVLVSTFWLKMF